MNQTTRMGWGVTLPTHPHGSVSEGSVWCGEFKHPEVVDMSRGGARNRSGPKPDPTSGRSDRREYSLAALPAAGFDGEVPPFPLMKRNVYWMSYEDKRPIRLLDAEATEAVGDREAELWEWAWRTPQACAWSMPSEGWRLHSIAMWVRTMVLCESSDATAADKNSLHRFADQIGLTTAGLAEMGWKIVAEVKASKPAPTPANDDKDEKPTGTTRRLRAV